MARDKYDSAFWPVDSWPSKFWPLAFWPLLTPLVPVQEFEETRVLLHPPCQVTAAYVSSVGLPIDVYWSHMPNAPDDAACVFDTTPIVMPKLHSDYLYQYYGISIMLRATDGADGAAWSAALYENLQQLMRADVSIDETTYRIKSVMPTGGVNYLGLEQGTQRRHIFTINVLLSLVAMEAV